MELLDHRVLLLWGIGAAICLHAGLLYAFLAFRSRDRTLAWFSLLCFLVTAARVNDMVAWQITDVPSMLASDRVWVSILIAQDLVFLYFVCYFTGFYRKRFVVPLTALWGLMLVANLVLPNTLLYSQVQGISSLTTSWGETWPMTDGELTAIAYLVLLASWAAIAYALVAGVVQYRNGKRTSAAIFFVGLAAIMVGGLHDLGLYMSLPVPVFSFLLEDFSFVIFVFAMGFEMSNRVADASRTKRTLLETRADYRRLVEQAADGFLVHTADEGRILDVNPHASAMLGYSRAQLTSMHIQELVGGEHYDRLRSIWSELRADEPVTLASVYRREDGTSLPVELRMGATMQDGSKLIVVLARDASERINAENERRSLEEQVQRAQKMEALGTLTGGIAHDFNNILTAVMGYTSLALGEVTGRPASHLEQVLRAGERAKNLVQQILTFSRQTSDDASPTELRPVIEESLRLLKATVPANIEIRSSLHSDGSVVADSTQMQQVLLNLCTNAAQAMEEAGGKITVELDEVEVDGNMLRAHPTLSPGPYLRLIVRDTGPGMAPELQPKVFEPFFTTKDEGQGTGLGLSVVHGIVRQHRGDIRLESSSGEGATFEVFLPRTSMVISHEPSRPENLPQGNERILVVDDEPSIAQLMKETLQSLGYRVDARTSSTEAVDLFLSSPGRYDLVITDSAMPEMTGSQLAMEILEKQPETPVILCTGFSATIDAERARALGIKAYLRKPVVAGDLAGTIREVLDAQPSAEMSGDWSH